MSERHPRGSTRVFLEPGGAVQADDRGLGEERDVGDVRAQEPVHEALDHASPDAAALPARAHDDVPYRGVEDAVGCGAGESDHLADEHGRALGFFRGDDDPADLVRVLEGAAQSRGVAAREADGGEEIVELVQVVVRAGAPAEGDAELLVEARVRGGERWKRQLAHRPRAIHDSYLRRAHLLFDLVQRVAEAVDIRHVTSIPDRVRHIARNAFQAFHRDMQEQWEDVLIVTMTEFGRTSKENGSRGTDHADSTAMFVAGGAVKGGVYNCDRTNWKNGDMFSTKNGRYLDRKTDFRSVFGEIFSDHFGNTPKQLDDVIPTYAQAKKENPSDFKKLGFIS